MHVDQTGQKAKGKEYVEAVWKNASQYLNYYLSLSNDRFLQSQNDCIRQIMIMQSTCDVAGMVSPQLEQKYQKQLNNLYTLYHGRGGRMPEDSRGDFPKGFRARVQGAFSGAVQRQDRAREG